MRATLSGPLRALRRRAGPTILTVTVIAVVCAATGPLVTGGLSAAMTAAGIPGLSSARPQRIATAPLALLLLLVIALVAAALGLVASIALAAAVRGGATGTRARCARGLRALRSRWLPVLLVAGAVATPSTALVLVAVSGAPPLVGVDAVETFGVPAVVGAALLGAVIAVLLMRVPCLLVEGARLPDALLRSVRAVRPRDVLLVVGALAAAGGLILGIDGAATGLAVLLAGAASAAPAAFVVPAAVAAVLRWLVIGMAAAFVIAAGGTLEKSGSTGSVRRAGRRPTGPVTAAVLAVLLAVGAVPAIARADAGRSPITIAGHRGDTTSAVEDTADAVSAAHAKGADVAEIDVQETADGRFVVIHDAGLTRLAGIDRPVGGMTQDELTATTIRTRAGSARIDTLDTVLRRAARVGIPLLIEVKLHGGESPGFLTRELAEISRRLPPSAYAIESLDAPVLRRIGREHPEVATAQLVSSFTGHLGPTDADTVLLDQTSLNEPIVAEAHLSGRSVWAWLPDTPAQLRTALLAGVDGVITDDVPAARTARDALQRRSLAARSWDIVTGW